MNASKILFPAAAAAATLLIGAPLVAQSVIVTPSSTNWTATDQNSGTAAITATNPDPNVAPSTGSIEFNTSGDAGKAFYTNSAASGGDIGVHSLSSVTSASFDWYRSGTSTQAVDLTPTFHFLVSDNGHSSELVWEGVYQSGFTGTAAVDSWQSVNLMGQTFWRSVYPGAMNGATNTTCGNTNIDGGSQANRTLEEWVGSCYDQAAFVYGVSVGDGSGWGAGSFQGFVDNVHVGFGADAGKTYNFETETTTPEPSSMALLGTGLIGLVPMIRRRRKR